MQQLQVIPYYIATNAAVINKYGFIRAAAQRFDTDRAGSGKKIDKYRTWYFFREYIKQGFPYKLRRRPG